jgi:hypothetical protein
MSAKRNYDDSVKEAMTTNACHRVKRQRTDGSLERLCKSEQAQIDREEEEETVVLEEQMDDSASETKLAS